MAGQMSDDKSKTLHIHAEDYKMNEEGDFNLSIIHFYEASQATIMVLITHGSKSAVMGTM